MERKRRDKINELELEKTRLEKAQEREKQILKDLRDLKISEELYLKKKDELESKINLKNTRLKEIANEILNTMSGENDTELNNKIKNTKESIKIKENIAQKKKTEKKNEDDEMKKKLDSKPKEESEFRYKKDYNYFYNRFLSIEDDLPSYLSEKLENMPNNKGYSFKNCWFFGKQPVDTRNNYTCIFDRQKNGIQVVHVNSPDCYRIIETPKFDNKYFENNLRYVVYEKWKTTKPDEKKKSKPQENRTQTKERTYTQSKTQENKTYTQSKTQENRTYTQSKPQENRTYTQSKPQENRTYTQSKPQENRTYTQSKSSYKIVPLMRKTPTDVPKQSYRPKQKQK